MVNRYQEACELIWEELKEVKKWYGWYDVSHYVRIEQILTMTESRIQDDMEDQHKAYLKDKEREEQPYGFV